MSELFCSDLGPQLNFADYFQDSILAEVLYVLSQDETNLLRLHFLSREEPDMVYYPAFFRCQKISQNRTCLSHKLATLLSQMDQTVHPWLPGCLAFRHQSLGDHPRLSLVFARQLSTATRKPEEHQVTFED